MGVFPCHHLPFKSVLLSQGLSLPGAPGWPDWLSPLANFPCPRIIGLCADAAEAGGRMKAGSFRQAPCWLSHLPSPVVGDMFPHCLLLLPQSAGRLSLALTTFLAASPPCLPAMYKAPRDAEHQGCHAGEQRAHVQAQPPTPCWLSVHATLTPPCD